MPPRAALACLAVVAALAACPLVLADADPASDVLLGENVFYPYDSPVSAHLQAALNLEVSAAHRARLGLKVALINTPVDLGAIPSFFGKPKQYAAFLDQEISFGNGKVPLLVVMPDGYGSAGLDAAATAAVAGLAKPGRAGGDVLAQAATGAVRKLAAAAGDSLDGAAGKSSPGGTGGVIVPLAILAAVCAALAAAILAVRARRAAPAKRPR